LPREPLVDEAGAKPGGEAGFSLLSRLWSFLGRRKRGVLPAKIRKLGRRRFSRRERGKSVTCRTRAGFDIQCQIGDPLDNHIYFEGEFEPELRLLLERLAPSLLTVVDVGCNIGYVSCLLATLAPQARILSIDANPEMIRRCESNLKLNGRTAEMLCCAAGSANAIRTFNIPTRRPSFASFGTLDYPCQEMEVTVRRLDELLRERGITGIDLLKIDVEGFEPEVLAGLGAFPVRNICFEFAPGNLKNCGFYPDDLWRLPLWNDYRLFLLETASARPLPFKAGEKVENLENVTEIVWAQSRAEAPG
jgi:FkbM family methyltransferase